MRFLSFLPIFFSHFSCHLSIPFTKYLLEEWFSLLFNLYYMLCNPFFTCMVMLALGRFVWIKEYGVLWRKHFFRPTGRDSNGQEVSFTFWSVGISTFNSKTKSRKNNEEIWPRTRKEDEKRKLKHKKLSLKPKEINK